MINDEQLREINYLVSLRDAIFNKKIYKLDFLYEYNNEFTCYYGFINRELQNDCMELNNESIKILNEFISNKTKHIICKIDVRLKELGYKN